MVLPGIPCPYMSGCCSSVLFVVGNCFVFFVIHTRRVTYQLYVKTIVHGQDPLLYGKNASLAVCVAERISSVRSWKYHALGIIVPQENGSLFHLHKRSIFPWPRSSNVSTIWESGTKEWWCRCAVSFPRGGVRWGTPLYKPYRYVRPHRVGFLSRFSLKTRIHFAILVYIKYQQVHSNKPINGAGSPNCRPGRWFSTIKLAEKYETANWSLRQGDEKVNKRIKQNIYTVFPRLIASIK